MGGFANVVKTADVRMIQRGDGACFTLESLSPSRIARKFLRKNLDGDNPIEACIPRLVHLAHAAGPDQLENLVCAKVSARVKPHGKSLSCRELYV